MEECWDEKGELNNLYFYLKTVMSVEALKSKIAKSLNEMDEVHLKHAYDLLKQLARQQKFSNIDVDKKAINYKIDKGIEQWWRDRFQGIPELNAGEICQKEIN